MEKRDLGRFVLNEGTYGKPDLLGAQDTLALGCLKEDVIPLWEVFEVEKTDEESNPVIK